MSDKASLNIPTFIWLCSAAALLIALAPLPYWYYTFLRIIVFAAAAFLTYQHYKHEQEFSVWVALLGGIAILFNPLIPIHLSREIWAPIDVIAAAVFLVHWRKVGVNRV